MIHQQSLFATRPQLYLADSQQLTLLEVREVAQGKSIHEFPSPFSFSCIKILEDSSHTGDTQW